MCAKHSSFFSNSSASPPIFGFGEILLWSRRERRFPENNFTHFSYLNGLTSLSQKFDFNADITFNDLINVEGYYVYVNNEYFAENPSVVFVNNGDVMTVDIRKVDDGEDSQILVTSKLI